jgi:2',3'-cyclic-nucleotide 2'-phosphodiesterase/3'-nucleotidase
VLETTDLHFNVRSYDYFKLAEDKTYGLNAPPRWCVRRAKNLPTPAGGQRRHHPGHRAGGLRSHHQPHPRTQQLSMYKAMGALGFDAGTLATTSSTTACPS